MLHILIIRTGLGAATDSRQLLDSRVRHSRVGRTLEYVVPG